MRAETSLAVGLTLALSGFAGLSLIPGFGPTVTVTQVNIEHGACGSVSQTEGGFSLPAAGEEQFSSATVVEYFNGESGVIGSVISCTAGFTVVSANTPYGGGPEPLEWTVQGPLFFHGQLNFSVNVVGAAGTSPPTNCSPCTKIPSGLYQFRSGEVLPSIWILVEAASLGTLISAVAWGIVRKY